MSLTHLVKHLPGKHNQKLHGRSGRGVTSPITEAQQRVTDAQRAVVDAEAVLAGMGAGDYDLFAIDSISRLQEYANNKDAPPQLVDEANRALAARLAVQNAKLELHAAHSNLVDVAVQHGSAEDAKQALRGQRDNVDAQLDDLAPYISGKSKYDLEAYAPLASLDNPELAQLGQYAKRALELHKIKEINQQQLTTAIEQSALALAQAGKLPNYNLGELHAQRTAARENGNKVAMRTAEDALHEARAAAWASQKVDGQNHDVTVRKSGMPTVDDYEAIYPILAQAQFVGRMGQGFNSNNMYHADLVHDALNKSFGLDGLPKLMTKAEVDSAVAAGGRELFRGMTNSATGRVTASQAFDRFTQGEFFAGGGVFGNGTYVGYGTDRKAANEYTLQQHGSGITRMVLKPDAKVVRYRDLVPMINDMVIGVQDRYMARRAAILTETAAMKEAGVDVEARVAYREREESEAGQIRDAYKAFADMSRYAAIAGYDAIDVDNNDTNYMVLLNRSAVGVEYTPYDKVP